MEGTKDHETEIREGRDLCREIRRDRTDKGSTKTEF